MLLLTERVVLSPHIKTTYQKHLVLSLEFYPFDFNYKLKAIVTQNLTVYYVFSRGNIRQM